MSHFEKKGMIVFTKQDETTIPNETNIIILEKPNQTSFHIPNYLTYVRQTQNFEEALKSLSKSKRKKIQNIIKKHQDKYEIIKQDQIQKETYLEWYQNVYLKSLNKKEKGLISAKENWYELDQNKKLAIYIKKEGKIIAGIIGREYDENESLQKRFSISYSGILRDEAENGLGEYLNLLIIDFAKQKGFDLITRGKDINFYGWHLSTGIPVFKTSLGYKITPLKTQGESYITPYNLDKFKDTILFFSFNKEKELELNIIIKQKDTDIKQLLELGMKQTNIYLYKNNKLELIV
jgi:hypothetical protein